jgi:hypothetical protein
MASSLDPDAAVVRLWLETNFPEVGKGAEVSLDSLRDKIDRMTPEVLAAMQRLAQAEAEELARCLEIQKMNLEAEAALKKVTEALNEEEAATRAAADAARDAARDLEQLAIDAERGAGEGEGESGKGGFAGLAGNVLKAEKVMSGLAGGGGFGRMGPMLESITSAMGLAGGAGLAGGGLIFAFEALLPKIDAFIEKMTGAKEAAEKAAKALHEHTAAMEKNKAAADKLSEEPTDEEAATQKAVKDLVKGPVAAGARAGIFQSLQASGRNKVSNDERGQIIADVTSTMGWTPKAQVEINRRLEERFGKKGVTGPLTDQELANRQIELNEQDASRMMNEMMAGDTAGVQAMATQRPGLFPAGFAAQLADTTPEARAQIGRNLADTERQDAENALVRKNLADTDKEDAKLASERADKDRKRQAQGFESTMRSDEHFAKQLYDRHTANVNAANHARTKAEHARNHAETLRKQAETKARHDAALNTPEHQLHAQEQAMHNEMIKDVQSSFPGLYPQEVEKTAREALGQLPSAGGDPFQAIRQAIYAAFQKGQQFRQEDMHRMNVFSEAFTQ